MVETGDRSARAPLNMLSSMTFRTRLVVLLVSTPLVAFAVVGGLLGKTVARDESYQHLRVFEDVVSLIANNYVEDAEHRSRSWKARCGGSPTGSTPTRAS